MQDIGIVTMTDHSTAPFFINVIEPQLGLNVTAIFEVFLLLAVISFTT